MKILKKLKRLVGFVLLAAWSVLLIRHSEQVTEGAKNALMRCINVIVPSLFAFMTAADILMRGGAYIYLSKPLAPFSRLIGLPRELGATFFIANIAGYPTGAAAVTALYDEGTLDRRSASRLLCTCYNGGPAFFAGVVGTAVFGSERTGLLVYLSIIAANILCAAVMYRVFPVKAPNPVRRKNVRCDLLTESTASAGSALFKACGMMLLFGAFLPVARECGLERLLGGLGENGAVVAESFLEISRLSDIVGRPYRLLPLISAAGAFGGVCVMLQVKAIVGGRFSLLPFAAARAVCAGIAGAVSVPVFRLFGEKAAEAAARTEFVVNFNNFIPSLCLIMMIFLTILRKRLVFSKQM